MAFSFTTKSPETKNDVAGVTTSLDEQVVVSDSAKTLESENDSLVEATWPADAVELDSVELDSVELDSVKLELAAAWLLFT